MSIRRMGRNQYFMVIKKKKFNHLAKKERIPIIRYSLIKIERSIKFFYYTRLVTMYIGPKGPFRNPISDGKISTNINEQEKSEKSVSEMGILAAIGVVLPFPFYWWLWTNPQSWVSLCGQGRDPSTVMARVSHVLKAAQLLSLFSVASLSWPPPLYFWPLIAFGQFLNFRSNLLPPVYISDS